MTIHAAKGLEFDAVFITGLEEGLCPHENALTSHDGLEEERRLMYVAITRARKRLYLSHAQTRLLHGQTRYHVRSRFVDELPEACLKWLTPRRNSFGQAPAPRGLQPAWGRSAIYPEMIASAPSVPVRSQPAAHGLAVGIKVFHTKFGEGRVLAVEGADADARAQVDFPRHGVKWLAVAVAKLSVVES
jgi:DNA helicase-2/ATP-dependent DNA helicase PcrA